MSVAPHLHIGFVEFLTFVLYLLIAGFLIRMVEISMHSNILGQSLSFIY
jgi:hypothetical protein